MKHIYILVFTFLMTQFNVISQEIAPYIKVSESSKTVQEVSDEVIAALKNNSFTILGAYNPGGKASLKVIAFTNNNLKNTVVKVADRGALAAAMKIGLVEKNGKTTISYTNPDYLLRAYLMNNYNTYRSTFEQFSKDVKAALV